MVMFAWLCLDLPVDTVKECLGSWRRK